MPAIEITFADMRAQVVHGLLIYCADYRCSHSIAINGDRWPNDARLSDIEPGFICGAYGHRGPNVRPDFNWNRQPVAMMGYRWCPGRANSAKPIQSFWANTVPLKVYKILSFPT